MFPVSAVNDAGDVLKNFTIQAAVRDCQTTLKVPKVVAILRIAKSKGNIQARVHPVS